MSNPPTFLKTHRNQIQNQAGQTIPLRGIGLGGWMNMENFVAGFPANESAFRQVVSRALGAEKAGFFFDRYLGYFFTAEDARFIRSLGLNTVRLSATAALEPDIVALGAAPSGDGILDLAGATGPTPSRWRRPRSRIPTRRSPAGRPEP